MEDDIDIYEDLPSFGIQHNENFIQNNEENVVGEQLQLKKQIIELTLKLENFQKVNENLEMNLFSLLKTAKVEIARKDKMINELRKKLDDIIFSRGTCRKSSNRIIHKSTFRETVINTHHEPNSDSNENNIKIPVAVSLYNQTKDQQNNSTLIPVTVFGERLLKRVIEEQNLEKKEKQSSKLGNNEITEGYTVESDKENGSLSGINICNKMETQSSVIAQCKEDEDMENSLEASKIKTKSFQTNNKNKISPTIQQTSIFTADRTGKRVNEEANRHTPIKRIKSTKEEHFLQSLKQEVDNNIAFNSKEKSILSGGSKSESSIYLDEKHRYLLKNSDTKFSCSSNTELKKHGHPVSNTNEKGKRKSWKNRNDISGDRKEANEHSLKRHNKSIKNSTFTLDERYIGYRCIEVFKRDGYRSNHSKYHGTKQREHHSINNHRSRIKSSDYIKSSREERYSRNSKYTNYEEKFEKPYNFRCTSRSTSKSKLYKTDSCNIRDTVKHFATDRIATEQKNRYTKRNERYKEYEPRKIGLHSTDDKPVKREDNQVKCNKYSHCKLNTENCIGNVKYSEISRRSSEKDGQVIKEMNRIARKENELGVHDELEKYAEEELQNTSIDLEDGEISNTPNNSPRTNGRDVHEGLINQQDVCKSNYTFTINNTNVISYQDQNNFENMESIENVENVENIQKFIRDYTYAHDKTSEKIPVTSNTICMSNDSLTNKLAEKEEDTNIVNDICNREEGTKDYRVSVLNTNQNVSAFPAAVENSEDTFVLCNSENNSIKDDHLKSAKDLLGKNERIESKSIKLTEDNYSTDNLVEKISEQPKMIDNSLESTIKDYALQNSYASSKIILDSSKAENEENDNINVENTIGVAVKNDITDDFNMKINLDTKNHTTMKADYKSVTVITETAQRDESNKYTERKEKRIEFEKSTQNQHGDKNEKFTFTNVHGKIVVFARRKKPVCLADSNANMTFVINNKYDTGVGSSSADNTVECNSISKFLRRSDRDTTNTS